VYPSTDNGGPHSVTYQYPIPRTLRLIMAANIVSPQLPVYPSIDIVRPHSITY